MIVGLTGRMASGKGTVAHYLVELGFQFFSLSDEIRLELRTKNMPESRENLTLTGNELRAAWGPAVLADRVIAKLEAGRPVVIDSIRNPAEVLALRAHHADFRLWYIDAHPQIRFERLKSRGRVGDVQTAQQFQEQEDRELHNADPTTQQLLATEQLADRRITNNADEMTLKKAVVMALNDDFGAETFEQRNPS